MNTEGILFDLWGTLIERTTPPLSCGLARALGPGAETAAAAWLKTEGRRDAGMDWLKIAGKLWSELRGDDPPQWFLDEAGVVRDDFLAGARLGPSAEGVLAAVRSSGCRVGALSNATALTLEVVARLDLRDALDDIWVSCETGWLKPEAEAFAVPLEAWALNAGAVCMVGDSLEDDVVGALSAGLSAIWLSADPASGGPPPDASVVRSLTEVPALL